MAIDLTNFWDPDYPTPPPLTDDLVRLVEQKFGVQLPPELLELLARQNGGDTQGFAYPTTEPTSWAENHVPFDELFGILPPSKEGPLSILDTEYLTKEWDLPKKQLLLSGDGHWFITLDYRHGPEPSVAWIDTEMDQDIQLADNFAAFLAGLVDSESVQEE